MMYQLHSDLWMGFGVILDSGESKLRRLPTRQIARMSCNAPQDT
jgi:hypothetical protein